MSLLQYTSKEMFSSTELIRKSKMIFDKVSDKDIEKAIILRDGKPSFILMDFETYENIMAEYLKLKDKKTEKLNEDLTKVKPRIERVNKEKVKENDFTLDLSNINNKDELKKEDLGLKDFWN